MVSSASIFSEKIKEKFQEATAVVERISVLTNQPCEFSSISIGWLFVKFPNLKNEAELMAHASFLNQVVMASYDSKQIIRLGGKPLEILTALRKLESIHAPKVKKPQPLSPFEKRFR